MSERLGRREQSLLFINRRGYAPLTICRACGHQIGCDQCDGSPVGGHSPLQIGPAASSRQRGPRAREGSKRLALGCAKCQETPREATWRSGYAADCKSGAFPAKSTPSPQNPPET
ncbi:hypothetical protein CNY89_05995 [Amaricoccus sp. HAR-UPW-R2A-40]|nr:hypothetical protein CNY89_05995 [Amaricoccus sp. HAR-UPW-R2A-40]